MDTSFSRFKVGIYLTDVKLRKQKAYLLVDKMKCGEYELIHGYVFINTEKGRTLDVVTKVANINGVKTACVITGTFDIVATFEVKDVKDVGEMVARGIDSVDGVSLTQTAICVKCCSK